MKDIELLIGFVGYSPLLYMIQITNLFNNQSQNFVLHKSAKVIQVINIYMSLHSCLLHRSS